MIKLFGWVLSREAEYSCMLRRIEYLEERNDNLSAEYIHVLDESGNILKLNREIINQNDVLLKSVERLTAIERKYVRPRGEKGRFVKREG